MFFPYQFKWSTSVVNVLRPVDKKKKECFSHLFIPDIQSCSWVQCSIKTTGGGGVLLKNRVEWWSCFFSALQSSVSRHFDHTYSVYTFFWLLWGLHLCFVEFDHNSTSEPSRAISIVCLPCPQAVCLRKYLVWSPLCNSKPKSIHMKYSLIEAL